MINKVPNTPPVLIIKPQSLEEIFPILVAIKERKTVIVNLTYFDAKETQKAIDCLSGCACAVDSKRSWIGEKTYLFVPYGVQLTSPKLRQENC